MKAKHATKGKLIDKRKHFCSCAEALDFIDKLAKKKIKGKKIQGNLHSHAVVGKKKKVTYTWSVTWKGKNK